MICIYTDADLNGASTASHVRGLARAGGEGWLHSGIMTVADFGYCFGWCASTFQGVFDPPEHLFASSLRAVRLGLYPIVTLE